MSDPSPMRMFPHTVLHDTAKLHAVNPSEISSEVIQSQAPSSDIQAFCSLIARILVRCLREGDERVLQILGLSKEPHEQGAHNGTQSLIETASKGATKKRLPSHKP